MNQELHLLNVEKYNCYAPKEKAILVTPDTAGHHLGNRRRFDAAATLVAPPVETMTVEDEDDDDCEIIPHSEVLVELIEGDDPREPDSDASMFDLLLFFWENLYFIFLFLKHTYNL